MSMEISNRYGFDHINKVQTGQTERAEEAVKVKEKDRPEKIPAPKDKYISSEKFGKKPSGLYHRGHSGQNRTCWNTSTITISQ